MLLVMPAAEAEAAVDVRVAPGAMVVVASLSEGARERGMLDEEDCAVVEGPVEGRMGM